MCSHCEEEKQHHHGHERDHDHADDHEGCCCGHEHEHGEEEHSKKWMIISLTRVFVGLALTLLGVLWLNEDNFDWWVNLLVMGTAWFIVSYDVLWKSLKALIHGHNPFDECFLMSVASIGAFCLRFFGPDHNEYFEAVMVMLLYQLGEFFQDLAADKSREAITSAIDLRHQKASVLNDDGSIVLKEAEDIHIGDVIILKVGEKCLSDGLIIEGEGNVDESSLTGEFVPVQKQLGSSISSGTILKSGSLKVKVEKEYADSTVAKLLELVEHSASKKSKADRFISRFSKIYTPIVICLAVLLAVVMPLCTGINDGGVWSRWIYVALCFLVISCPCAIVISVPLAYFAGLGLASKNGMVVKGAEIYDKLNKMNAVAFDKTGTITKGEFKIKNVYSPLMENEEFMSYIYAAESRSTHPIAHAICKDIDVSNFDSRISDYQELPGRGISLCLDDKNIMVVNRPLDERNASSEIGTHIYLIIGSKDYGYIVLNDELKDNSKSAISELKNKGVKTILLSGDKTANVEAISTEIGIDEFHAELTPEGKINILEEKMKNNNGYVGFVGDGINDAPSIVGADVGFGMGGLGSDVVVQNADVVFMDDDISHLNTVINIARKTENRATFNIVFALIFKGGVMLASIFWQDFPLWLATIADSGLALALTLNSLMLLKAKVTAKK